jgi:hypothetical protein
MQNNKNTKAMITHIQKGKMDYETFEESNMLAISWSGLAMSLENKDKKKEFREKYNTAIENCNAETTLSVYKMATKIERAFGIKIIKISKDLKPTEIEKSLYVVRELLQNCDNLFADEFPENVSVIAVPRTITILSADFPEDIMFIEKKWSEMHEWFQANVPNTEEKHGENISITRIKITGE